MGDSTDLEILVHLETYLGPIVSGWTAGGQSTGPQMVEFHPSGIGASVGFATLGLGRHSLSSWRNPSKKIRQEVLVLAPLESRALAAELVDGLATKLLAEHRALLRGEVVNLHQSVTPQSPMESLYVASPVYFPDEFAVCRQGMW